MYGFFARLVAIKRIQLTTNTNNLKRFDIWDCLVLTGSLLVSQFSIRFSNILPVKIKIQVVQGQKMQLRYHVLAAIFACKFIRYWMPYNNIYIYHKCTDINIEMSVAKSAKSSQRITMSQDHNGLKSLATNKKTNINFAISQGKMGGLPWNEKKN